MVVASVAGVDSAHAVGEVAFEPVVVDNEQSGDDVGGPIDAGAAETNGHRSGERELIGQRGTHEVVFAITSRAGALVDDACRLGGVHVHRAARPR